MEIYTIGHSTRTIEDFINLLKQNDIRCVVDIRRWPASRKWPQFNREPLAHSLTAEGIQYVWMEDLGGRRHKARLAESPNTGLTSPGFRNYADYMLTEQFHRAINDLLKIADERRTAIMCAERLFWKCHRKLVSDYLYSLGVAVRHILDENTVKQHKPTAYAHIEEGRVTYPGQMSLFNE